MAKALEFTATQQDAGMRLDVFLSRNASGMTRSAAQKLIGSGAVCVCGKTEQKVSRTVRPGDVITLSLPKPRPTGLAPQNIPLEIVYEDDYLAVINKQQGLTVHPAGGAHENTLVNALLFHIKNLSGINGELRPGIVHRLDKDTSGLMLVAKCDAAHQSLQKQIQDKTCRRTYVALVEGVVKAEEGTVDVPIGRSQTDRKKMAALTSAAAANAARATKTVKAGKASARVRSAVTNFQVMERFKNTTFVKFSLVTGRTHQIRVHAKHIGHPVVGDAKYGFKTQKFNLEGQLLHSNTIEFTHPKTGERMSFEAPLPPHFQRVLDSVRKANK